MERLTERDNEPWYRQFWPWFLIALPATVVVAGISMIFVAFENADSLVNDNYYRDGMAINQVLEQDLKASEMGVSATITVDNETGEILVNLLRASVPEKQTLENNAPSKNDSEEPLQLLLMHPTDEKKDQTFSLQTISSDYSSSYYRTDLDAPLANRYYLRLLPLVNPAWRLNGEITLPEVDRVTLLPQ